MTRADPTKQRFPNLRGIMMVDTVRGRVRVRAWPKKRGRPKSPAVRDQNRWFREACRHIPYIDASQMVLAIGAAKGTGLYPRDIIMNAMAGGFLEFEMPDGRILKYRKPFLEEVMFQGCTLQKDATQTLIAGNFVTLTWPLPLFDTAGFWNVAAPTRIPIPTNVSIISLIGGFRSDNIITNGTVAIQILKNGVEMIRDHFTYSTWPNCGVFSGPRDVVEGDYFEMTVYAVNTQRTGATTDTYFSLEVLQVP